MPGPFWAALALGCAIVWVTLRLVSTMDGAEDVKARRLWTRVVLAIALIYLVLWAAGASGPFVAWRS